MTVEIPRYLADPERGVILHNGASVRVRAVRPDDERRLLALCGRLSPPTLYQRFFSFRRLLPEEVRAFANVDYDRRPPSHTPGSRCSTPTRQCSTPAHAISTRSDRSTVSSDLALR